MGRVAPDGSEYRVLFMDLDPDIFHSRLPAFDRLAGLIAADREEKLIVMGDFNTPREPMHFDSLRANGMRQAFEAAGPWPVPLPVLSLDHVWTSPGLKPVSCRLGFSPLSDHRMVVADFWGWPVE